MTESHPQAVWEREPGRDTALSWPEVPSHSGDGHGKQEEQEGSTCCPLALCGLNNNQSLVLGSCQSVKSRAQPGTSHPFFFNFRCFANWRSVTSSTAGATPLQGRQHSEHRPAVCLCVLRANNFLGQKARKACA